MRVQGAKKSHYDAGPNMTPLVDVVMVILIFLMLAGTFSGAEWYIQSHALIVKQGFQTQEEMPNPPPPDPPIQLIVKSYGSTYNVTPGGLPTIRGSDLENQAVASEQSQAWVKTQMRERLIADLIRMRQQLGKSHASPNDSSKMIDTDTQVVIGPDSAVKWTFLIDVYQAAIEAGFTKIGFATI